MFNLGVLIVLVLVAIAAIIIVNDKPPHRLDNTASSM
jgi:hypothetical protein